MVKQHFFMSNGPRDYMFHSKANAGGVIGLPALIPIVAEVWATAPEGAVVTAAMVLRCKAIRHTNATARPDG